MKVLIKGLEKATGLRSICVCGQKKREVCGALYEGGFRVKVGWWVG